MWDGFCPDASSLGRGFKVDPDADTGNVLFTRMSGGRNASFFETGA